MGAEYSSLGSTKVLYATSSVLVGEKAKFLRRKPSVLVALEDILDMLAPINTISDGDINVFCRLSRQEIVRQ